MLTNFNKIGILLTTALLLLAGLLFFEGLHLFLTKSQAPTKIISYISDTATSTESRENGQEEAVVALEGQQEALIPEEVRMSTNASSEKNILFVGDIMLARGVEYQIKINNNNFFYPFEKIHQLLKGFDIVFGNLEGPIVESPPSFPDTSFKFAFRKENAQALSEAGFTVLSLANNHSDNMGWQGIEETRGFLKEKNIDTIGEPSSCVTDFSYKKDSFHLLVFNKTFPFNCSDGAIATVVKEIRLANPEDFLAASLHWGEEYQAKSSDAQKELAHKLVEAGADLIVGHHPHTVQEIELYQGKPIFYSLGNFIFDQYFSEETQEGLAVSAIVYPVKSTKVVYTLFPLQSYRSQPFLLETIEAQKFLERLAQKSSIELLDKIRTGIIELSYD